MKARIVTPTAAHRQFRTEVIELLRKHAGALDAKDMLALSAHLVGQVIAMQDQRTMTHDIALEIVMRNIEAGNSEVLNELGKSVGTS